MNYLNQGKSFAAKTGLIYIEIDFNKQQNTEIIFKVLKVRLNQSFSQYTEFYLNNIKQHLNNVIIGLIKIFENESLENENCKNLTLSSIESKVL